MSPATSLRDRGTDIDRLDPIAEQLLLLVRYGVGDDDTAQLAIVESRDGVST